MIPVEMSFLEIKISKLQQLLSVCKTKKMEKKKAFFSLKAQTINHVFGVLLNSIHERTQYSEEQKVILQ